MRKFEFEGNTYTLTEKQYYKLLNRFDEGFAEESPWPYADLYVIKRPCICDEFHGCLNCSLYKGPHQSCDKLVGHVMGVGSVEAHAVFYLGASKIRWRPHQDVYARRLLRKVYKALRRLPYVEEEEA